MVKIMEHPIKMDDFGGNTPIFGNTLYMYPPEAPQNFVWVCEAQGGSEIL